MGSWILKPAPLGNPDITLRVCSAGLVLRAIRSSRPNCCRVFARFGVPHLIPERLANSRIDTPHLMRRGNFLRGVATQILIGSFYPAVANNHVLLLSLALQ